MLAVMRQRNFALLWLGNVVSLLGNWILLVALPFYIYQRTGSVLATGATFIVETIPALVLGSLAGVFADRWDRRRTLIVTNVLQAFFLLPLLGLQSHTVGLWIVYVVALIQSIISQLAYPAFSGLLPNLLAEADQLTAANGAMSVAAELTRLIGPALGGALLGLLGLTAVVLADSVSFVFCALMVLCIMVPPQRREAQPAKTDDASTRPSLWGEWRLGLRLVATDPVIGALFVVTGIAMLGEGTGRAVVVPFLSDIAGGNALAFGWILTAQGAGGVVGSLLLHRASILLHPFRLIALAAALDGTLVLIETTVRTLPVVLVCSFFAGAPIVLFYVSVDTLLQQRAEDRYRGRIFGAYNTTSTVVLLVGMVLSSLLADRVGLVLMFAMMGAFYVLAGVTAAVLLRRPPATPPPNSTSTATLDDAGGELSRNLAEHEGDEVQPVDERAGYRGE